MQMTPPLLSTAPAIARAMPRCRCRFSSSPSGAAKGPKPKSRLSRNSTCVTAATTSAVAPSAAKAAPLWWAHEQAEATCVEGVGEGEQVGDEVGVS